MAPVLKRLFVMRKKGFTLIEIIVSTVILALVIAGLTNIFVVGKRRIVFARSKMQTAELGRLFLDPLQNQVRQDEWASNCLGSNTGCPTSPQNISGMNYAPTYNISNVSGTNLRRVTVIINWNETAP